ncbi:uncharacterized protein LOC124636069 [Helicoverpa zea]|uniref:uncharacterized protein LOC124636069 n=1 Tax=Helicoverpa zea TaxID=7113 RepID=UPI001F58A396|nr:uncharacterized protein LOC124636069 [Helicoverpa zea]
MDGNNFTKYLKEKLIPNLPENSILVMDNASYHSMQVDKAPTTRKKHRPEKKYLVDELLREHGHEVLRLPPYNCDLNPIEHVWNLIKPRVADKNVEQHENKIEEVTKEAIPSITRDDWKKQINHIKKVEEEYWNRDVGRESEIEVFIISVGMNSDSEDESDDYEDQDCESDQSVEDNNELMEGIEPIMGSDDQDTAGPSGL